MMRQTERKNAFARAFLKIVAALGFAWMFSGCVVGQWTMVSDVKDGGLHVQTRHKYYVVAQDREGYTKWLKGEKKSGRYIDSEGCVRAQPGVFAVGGIPIVVSPEKSSIKKTMGLQICSGILCFASCGIIPFVGKCDYHGEYAISLLDDAKPSEAFLYVGTTKECMSFSPLALLHLLDTKPKGMRSGRAFRAKSVLSLDSGDYYKKISNLSTEAVAYAIATKLKEIEDKGIIDEEVLRLAKEAWARHNSQ